MKLHERIVESLADVGPKVEDAVVDAMVTREVNKRSQAIVTVMDKLHRLENETKKISKPDQESYDGEGKLVSQTFSKEKAKAIKEHGEKVEKVRKALSKALDEGDYSLLYDLASKSE